MRANRIATVVAAFLPLAACGGGGGVASTGNPTPAPSPTPTPSPTPSPTPTPASYTRIQDLTGNQTFVTASTSVTYNSQGVPVQDSMSGYPFGAGANSSTVVLKYLANTDTYVVEGYGTSASFGQADLVASGDPKTIVLEKSAGGTVTDRLRQTTPSPGGIDLSYVRFGSWMTTRDPTLGGRARLTFIAGGVPTIASDVPTTGTASFSTSVIGLATDTTNGTAYDLAQSSATFSADFAANTVQTSLTLFGIPVGGAGNRSFGTFNGSGTIGNSSPTVINRNIFAGTLTTSGPGNAGFTGSFFGPQASEFAYVWSLFQNGLTAEGVVAGKR